jgi:hypothetical protein
MHDAKQPATISQTPDMERIQKDYEAAGGSYYAATLPGWIDQKRYTRWAGQSRDGRKHREAIGAEPHPHEGAADTRVPMADAIIDDLVDIMMEATSRAQLDVTPIDADDIERAANARKVLKKYIDRMNPDLDTELEFAAQQGVHGGAVAVQVTWETRVEMVMEEIDLQAIQAQAGMAFEQRAQQGGAQDDYSMVEQLFLALQQENEEEAAALLQAEAAQFAQKFVSHRNPNVNWAPMEDYQLGHRRAMVAVRELLDKGQTAIPVPEVICNQPLVIMREFGVDLFVNGAITDIQRCPCFHVVEWLSVEDVKQNQVAYGWDKTWVDKAIATAGSRTVWARPNETMREQESLNTSETWSATVYDASDEYVEVVTTFKRYVSEEGVAQIWQTTWCPHAGNDGSGNYVYGKHDVLDYRHGRYPIVAYRRERKKRCLSTSRGVSEIAATWQDAIKSQMDMLRDRADKELNPPLKVRKKYSLAYGLGPSVQLPTKSVNDTDYMSPPTGNPGLAINLIELITAMSDNYFGLISEAVPPPKWQTRQGRQAGKWLQFVGDVYSQVFALIQQFADDADLQRLSAGETQFPRTMREIKGQYDWTLHFNVGDLDIDYALKKLEAIIKTALPIDRGGKVDTDALVGMIINAIDPTYSAALLRDSSEAQDKIFQETMNAFMEMFQGNEPKLLELDPAAQMRLQAAQQIVQNNPKYQSALGMAEGGQVDPVFQELVQRWTQSAEQSVAQQNNAHTGRVGAESQLQRVQEG